MAFASCPFGSARRELEAKRAMLIDQLKARQGPNAIAESSPAVETRTQRIMRKLGSPRRPPVAPSAMGERVAASELAVVGKGGLRAAGALAGKALAIGQAAYVITECSKDLAKLHEMTSRGIKPDEKLVATTRFCATDAFLGRGSTQAVLTACRSANGCARGAYHVGKALVYELPKAVISSAWR
jgi:hypothetical protein